MQEFQINRSNYAADLGAATGASINIVTKSGTNNVHGTLYGFFRNDALDAQNPFSFSQALQPGQTFNPANPDTEGFADQGYFELASNSAERWASRSKKIRRFCLLRSKACGRMRRTRFRS